MARTYILLLTLIFADGERLKILDWLSKIPFENHHLFIRSFRQADTGTWLLDKKEFIEWKDSSSSLTLWLHDIAGAGKTTLASLVIDTFESTKSIENGVAYFYCKHGENDRQDPVSILSTIVKELSILGPKGSLPESVVSAFHEHQSKSGILQLSESQTLISSLAENFVRTVIVIGARDECDKESRIELLSALDLILNSSAGVINFFITSRDADDILLQLEGAPNVYIHSSDNSGDIATFVRAEVKKCISKKLLLRGSVAPEIKEYIIEKITNGADGMFLWASIQITQICEAKILDAVEKALQRLPKGLKGIYSVIWDKICGLIEENQILARKTLKWILCAQTPLAEAEIIDDVSIEPMDFSGNPCPRHLQVEDLLDVCQNLIVMDEQLRVLRTTHFSVDEFLEDHFDISEAHNQAVEICFTLMHLPKIYGEPPMLHPTDKFYNDSWPLTPRPEIYDKPHPLRYYMFDHWVDHLRFSGEPSNSLLDLQKEFFNASPTYYAWLQEAEKRSGKLTPMHSEVKLTPLWVATYYQLWYICNTLLKSNVDNYNIRNRFGETPLLVAADLGNEEEGVEIDSGNYANETPLYVAAKKGHDAIVKLLLEKEGVNINYKVYADQTPLCIAVGWGQVAAVKLLLEKAGVDINSKDRNGETPIWVVAIKGYVMVVKLLLEKEGLDINSKDKRARHH
ncbi:hypothetical protein RUND412_010412 [Rhizina undulata]